MRGHVRLPKAFFSLLFLSPFAVAAAYALFELLHRAARALLARALRFSGAIPCSTPFHHGDATSFQLYVRTSVLT